MVPKITSAVGDELARATTAVSLPHVRTRMRETSQIETVPERFSGGGQGRARIKCVAVTRRRADCLGIPSPMA
jgi:hypothetical protein